MNQLVGMESAITDKNLAMVYSVTAKDRGPFFYWLLNECALSKRSRTNCTALHTPVICPAEPLC
jgi:hypothetical protein